MNEHIQLEVKGLLWQAYPDVELHIPDRKYFFPSEYKIWDELISSYMEDYKYLSGICDCDDFALFLHAWIRQQQYKEKWPLPMAFGEAWSSTHALNIVILEDSTVHLIEPQNDKLLPADAYDINFIRM